MNVDDTIFIFHLNIVTINLIELSKTIKKFYDIFFYNKIFSSVFYFHWENNLHQIVLSIMQLGEFLTSLVG